MISDDVNFYVLFSAIVGFITWAAVIVFSIKKMQLPIYHPFFIYLIYHFVGFVLRPFTVFLNEESFLWIRIGIFINQKDILLVTAVSCISLFAVTLGVYFSTRKFPVAKIEPLQFNITRPVLFVLAVIGVSLLGYYGTYKSFFGAGLDSVLAYKTSLDSAGGQRLVGVSGYVTALAEFLPIVCIVLFLSPKTRKFSLLFIAFFVAVRFYAGAQRLSFVVVLAALFLIYHIEKGVRYPKVTPIALILVFAFVFEIIGNDRYAFRKLLVGTESVESIFSSYVEERGGNALTSDIVEFDVATAVIKVVSEHDDLSYGTQYLRLLIWPIPRQIWNEKPVYTNIVDLNKYGDFRYLTTSLYADVFMVFGFASVIAMMSLLGWFIAKLYEFVCVGKNIYIFGFYWVFLIYMKTILRDGGVTVVYFWGFSMVAFIVLVRLGGLELCRRNPQ